MLKLKPQHVTYILGALVLLLIGGVVFNAYQQQKMSQSAQTAKQFLAETPTDSVTSISLIKKTGTVDLSKQNDTWVISSNNNIPADGTAISSLLATLNHTIIQAIASRQSDNAASFGLDEDTRLDVVIKAGDRTITELYVGNTGAVPQTFYAQRPGETTIYLVSGARYTLDKSSWKQPENPNEGQVTNTTVPINASEAN